MMIVAAMKRLQDMGASYFVLDLRDNLGGLVQVSVLIFPFICNGKINQIKRND